ncbi:MAG: FlgD immunoglobulin-like domain containing protein [Candidatus Eisenbacteria bacterium]
MEATGLWDFESGENPQVDFANLSKLLTALERDSRIKVTTYSEFMHEHSPVEDVSPVVDGAADWMGRDAWFAENSAPEAQAYRAFFSSIRDTLNAIHSTFGEFAPDTVVARTLVDHAWFTLCAHQYEFAVHGYGGMVGTTQWDLARDALVSGRAARYALATAQARAGERAARNSMGGRVENPEGVRVLSAAEDINGDTVQEIVFASPTDLYVFSSYGGQLLYWFDLEDGHELVGSENFMRAYGEAYTNDNAYVPAARGSEAYPWLSANMIYPEIHQWTFEARRRCFNDSIWVNGVPARGLVNRVLGYTLDTGYVEFQYDLGETMVAKRITPSRHCLSLAYAFSSISSQTSDIDIQIENGLSPDCLGVMMTGKRALKYWDGQDTSTVFSAQMPGVVNVLSTKGLLFDFTDPPTSVSGEEDVFGLEVNPRWQFELPPYGTSAVTLQLTIASYSGVTPGDGNRPHGKLVILPNPSRGTVEVRLWGRAPAELSGSIFDTSGRLVRTLRATAADGGAFLAWDGLDQDGLPVASGIYLLRVDRGGTAFTGKVVVVR